MRTSLVITVIVLFVITIGQIGYIDKIENALADEQACSSRTFQYAQRLEAQLATLKRKGITNEETVVLGDFKVYTTILTTDQIAQIYRAAKTNDAIEKLLDANRVR